MNGITYFILGMFCMWMLDNIDIEIDYDEEDDDREKDKKGKY